MGSLKNKITGVTAQLKGTIKQEMGNKTNRENLKAEGQVDKVRGQTKETTSDVQEHVSSSIHKMGDKFRKAA